MEKINSVWIVSTPRTGSMWTANVVREIYKAYSYNVLPKTQFHNDEEYLKFYTDNALQDKNDRNKYILKIHRRLSPKPPRSLLIANIRNPYDVCASYYEFTKCDLNKAIEVSAKLSIIVDHYRKLSKDLFEVRYEEIENRPEELIKRLANLCKAKLSLEQIKKIAVNFSKDNIKNLIESNDQKIKLKIDNKQKIDDRNLIKTKTDNYRFFDLKTGFQTNHISQRRTGEWKKVFSTKEIDEITDKLDQIAVEFGYSKEK